VQSHKDWEDTGGFDDMHAKVNARLRSLWAERLC
jgi:hypothetical protein